MIMLDVFKREIENIENEQELPRHACVVIEIARYINTLSLNMLRT